MLLANSKLNCMQFLISKTLINSNISPNDFYDIKFVWYQIRNQKF